MAHFAQLDNNDVVLRVIVVSNADTSTPDGNEVESIGIAFCQRLFGGNWRQTSYNGNMRELATHTIRSLMHLSRPNLIHHGFSTIRRLIGKRLSRILRMARFTSGMKALGLGNWLSHSLHKEY